MTKNSNYKKWSFRLLMCFIIINSIIFFLVINFAFVLHNYRNLQLAIGVLTFIAGLILIIGTIITIVSIKNKELKDYQYYFSVIGYPIFLIMTLILTLSRL